MKQNFIQVPSQPPKEQTVNLGSRGPYISRRVWEDAYRRITIWFDEYGNAIKSDYKSL